MAYFRIPFIVLWIVLVSLLYNTIQYNTTEKERKAKSW